MQKAIFQDVLVLLVSMKLSIVLFSSFGTA